MTTSVGIDNGNSGVRNSANVSGEVAAGIGADLVQGDGGVGAHGEERRGAEIHVAAIAAEDVPGGRQHDVLQHDKAGEQHVLVAGQQREREHDGADQQCDEAGTSAIACC